MWQHSVKKDKKVSCMVFYAKTDNLEKLAKTSTILSIIWKKKDLALSVIACMQTSPIEEIGDVCTRGNASDNDNQSAVGPDKFVNGLFSCGNMEAESL